MILKLVTPDGLAPLGPEGEAGPLVAVLPGDGVALHRVQLSESEAAARLAEARMRAIDLAAQPEADLHVAVGPADAQGFSWIGIADRTALAADVESLREQAPTVAHLVPAALLLPQPDSGPAMAGLDGRVLVNTGELAGLVEPELAKLLTGAVLPPRPEALPPFAPVPPDEVAGVPLDLLQGDFAPRRAWWRERRFRIAALLLGALVLLLALAPFAIERGRAAAAIVGYDSAVVELARTALGSAPDDAGAASAALAEARRAAEGGAIGARLSHVAARLETVPGARLERVALLPDGSLALLLGGPAESITQAQQAILSGGFAGQAEGAALTLSDRRAAVAPADAKPLERAMARFVAARTDAALLAAARARPAPPDAAQIQAAFAAAGLADAVVAPGTRGPRVSVPAARATVLLPLLADLELRGARIVQLAIAGNADQTLNATLETEAQRP
ncbi:MAG: type II secretion system protein GspL [Sphingomonadaceae bacterium]